MLNERTKDLNLVDDRHLSTSENDVSQDHNEDRPVRIGANAIWRIGELVGYGFVSVAALLIDTLILRYLVTYARVSLVTSSLVAFSMGSTAAYLLSTIFVFKSRRVQNRSLEFAYFVALGLAGVLVNTLVLSFAFETAGLNLITSKLIAALFTFSTNFVLRRWFLFSSPRSQQ